MSDDDAIFVAEDGSPLRVFVEATDIPDRAARLIKKLKKGGAEIRIAPRDADIIIVGEDVDIRRRTVNASRHKIVLDYKWVQASLKREAAYLEKDNWGHYRVFPEEQNGGPTPATDTTSTFTSGSAFAQSQPMSGHIPNGFPPPNLQLTQEQLTALAQQLGLVPPMQPAPYSQPWATDPANLLSGPTMLVPVQLQQRILDHMLNLVPGNALSWSYARLVAQFTAQQAPGNITLPGLPSLAHANHATLSALTQPHVQPVVPVYNSLPGQPPVFQQGSSNHVLTQAVRPSDSASATVPVKRERQIKDEGSSRHKKHKKRNDEDEDESSARNTPEQPQSNRTPARRTSIRPVFVDRKGKAIPFWVQYARWRSQYVPDIQKYGGKIVGDIADADYAVIFSQQNGSWDYLRTAIKVDATAVKPSYITACIEKGKLVKSSRYSFEGTELRDDDGNKFVAKLANLRTSKHTQHKKVSRTIDSSSDEEDEEEEEEEVEEVEEEEESEDEVVPKTRKSSIRFTHQELAEGQDYLEELFVKDPNMSNEAVYEALERKLPRHTAAAWELKVGGDNGYVGRARKRAITRAAVEQKPDEDPRASEPPPTASQVQTSVEPQPAVPTAPEQTLEATLFHDDLVAITKVFVNLVNGPYTDKSDEEVFAILSDQVACKTAPSWQDFYTRNSSAVEDLVRGFSENAQ
ncbi:BRCT domain-containing protein [Phanerochaete sordida]|uniref:BRCT domain-containing protein n=1 Tax=Phanerochaete sordida TaxID=48140 RepID=A0A9P3G4Y1_9APHY|nr:BRCT domain-containing protein [Phanerochaete sordida]